MMMTKGGLLNELELRIKASQELQWQYEKKKTLLEIETNRLNDEYIASMMINTNNLSDYNLKQLLDYRQVIINKICSNNEKVDQLNVNKEKQSEIQLLLGKCHKFIEMY